MAHASPTSPPLLSSPRSHCSNKEERAARRAHSTMTPILTLQEANFDAFEWRAATRGKAVAISHVHLLPCISSLEPRLSSRSQTISFPLLLILSSVISLHKHDCHSRNGDHVADVLGRESITRKLCLSVHSHLTHVYKTAMILPDSPVLYRRRKRSLQLLFPLDRYTSLLSAIFT
jgi:hypothetical protein